MNILWIILPLMVTWSTIGALSILEDVSMTIILFGGFITIVTMICLTPFLNFDSYKEVISKSAITNVMKGDLKNA